ncbi:SDR family oxidoreductase [Novosphingobium profundi]|uniref:SDR family oxidoreductase n=1 Tax=Novosphingobium profundi TaxID=1774954 RepID=UPI001BDA1E0B|nr:SDR family oxidoreductase [Novosphingobium profundi]MBT0668139.1 SDR family oxidoreductase [Novosphingobium profundi]
MSVDLNGRTILVSGAARGLGAAFAQACCSAGARIAVADIDADGAESTAQKLREQGGCAEAFAVDIADPGAVDVLALDVAKRLGGIDGLLNNAALATGIGGKLFEDIDIDQWDQVMRINVRGTWLMTKAFSPMLRRSAKGGRILNIASDTALWGAPRLLHYVASKGAIISMTRSLSREFGEDGVTVNALAPGLVRVQATEYVPEERKQLYVDGAAIRRPQVPDDTVGAAVFLLSDASAFVSGQILPVNGGFISA